MAENMEADVNPSEPQPTTSNPEPTEQEFSVKEDEQILIEDTPQHSTDVTSPAPMEDTAPAENTADQVPAVADDPAAATESAEANVVTGEQCLSHSKTPSDTIHFNKSEIVNDVHANKLWIVCSVCKSKILQPNAGLYIEKDADLPPLLKKDSIDSSSSSQEIPVERVSEFWKIKDMFHFENIGVSKTIGTTKYLLCADCEIGPIGFHVITNAQEFLLAANRVMYANSI